MEVTGRRRKKYNPLVTLEKEEFFELIVELIKNADKTDDIIKKLLINLELNREFTKYVRFKGYVKKREGK